MHYLDDFLVIGTRTGIGNSTRVVQETGIPISVHKTERPSDIPATSAGMTPDVIPTPFNSMLEGMWPTTSGPI